MLPFEIIENILEYSTFEQCYPISIYSASLIFDSNKISDENWCESNLHNILAVKAIALYLMNSRNKKLNYIKYSEPKLYLCQELLIAVIKGKQIDSINIIMQTIKELHPPDEFHMYVLILLDYIALSKNYEIVRYFHNKYALVYNAFFNDKYPAYNNNSPSYLAIKNAIYSNNIDIFKLIYGQKLQLNTEKIASLISHAITHCDLDMVKLCFETLGQFSPISFDDEYMIRSIEYKKTDIFEFLYEKYAPEKLSEADYENAVELGNPDFPEYMFINDLYFKAISHNNIHIVKFLYERFSKVDFEFLFDIISDYEEPGKTDVSVFLYEKYFLTLAAPYREWDLKFTCNTAIKYVLDLHNKGLEFTSTTLQRAINYCDFDVIKYLISEISINNDIDQDYEINVLFEENRLDILKYLIDNNIKINIQSIDKNSIIEIVSNGYLNVLEFMLENHEYKKLFDKVSVNELLKTALKNSHYNIFQQLMNNLRKGSNNKGWGFSPQLIKFFLTYGYSGVLDRIYSKNRHIIPNYGLYIAANIKIFTDVIKNFKCKTINTSIHSIRFIEKYYLSALLLMISEMFKAAVLKNDTFAVEYLCKLSILHNTKILIDGQTTFKAAENNNIKIFYIIFLVYTKHNNIELDCRHLDEEASINNPDHNPFCRDMIRGIVYQAIKNNNFEIVKFIYINILNNLSHSTELKQRVIKDIKNLIHQEFYILNRTINNLSEWILRNW